MSFSDFDSQPSNRSSRASAGSGGGKWGYFLAFLFLSGISVAIVLSGVVLGIEPRLTMVRSGDGTFRVTGENYLAGRQFYTKTIEGVQNVTQDDAVREGHNDSMKEDRRRRKQKHLEMYGSDGARIGWDRESDQRVIEAYMRGTVPRLALANPPPLWRLSLSWFCLGLGTLTFIGAIQSSFFPKKKK